MTDADGRAQRSDQRRGLRVAIALVVVMAAGVAVLGLTNAFPGYLAKLEDRVEHPTVSIDRPLASGPARPHAYLLSQPRLTRADAQRIFAAGGVTARAQGRGAEFTAGPDDDSITDGALGWFVNIGSPTPDPAVATAIDPPRPPDAEALAVARRTLATIGVTSDSAKVSGIDFAARATTIVSDRAVDGRTVRLLRWTVVVGPGDRIEGLSGFLTDVTDAGPVLVATSRATADQFATPRSAKIAIDGRGGQLLWDAISGFGLTAADLNFESDTSARFVLFGSGPCDPFANQVSDRRAQTPVEFVPSSGGCFFADPTTVHVRRAVATLGAVILRPHDAFLVPSYRFTVRFEPHTPGHPRDTTIVLSAVDAAQLARLARSESPR